MKDVPAQIGSYPVVSLLARGGMGAVYLGRHPVLGYEVAIKVLLAGRNASAEQRSRFQREVASLAKLQHPGVVNVLEAGEEEGVPWFAMRRVEGTSLEDRMHREGPLPTDEVVQLGQQLSVALAEAHDAGILHRDLKPDNVLCTPDGQLELTDFGLAKDLEVKQSIHLSQTGILQGTPRYWSPEQARGEGGAATRATDVYGLGATLYAALTGEPPVGGQTWAEVLLATTNTPPTPPRARRPEVPDWLERVVLRCLEKNPENRYESMSALGAALEREPAPGIQGGTKTVALSAGLAVLALALVGALAWPQVTPADDPKQIIVRADALAKEEKFAEARPLLLRAAELGEPRGMGKLGVMYVKGRGVEKDEAEAARWFRRAADLGERSSMTNLGIMLLYGRGVQKNEAEAVRWFRSAAKLGHPDGMFRLGLTLHLGTGVAKDEKAAARWFRRSAELGDTTAMFNLGIMLLYGQGAKKNEAEAARWFRRAAELGDRNAMHNLGAMLAGGRGVDRDSAEAIRWYHRAADLGNSDAMFTLGLIYEGGLGAARSDAKAVHWWRKAAELGDSTAMHNLALLLERGRGTQKNDAEAARWYRRAAELGDPDSMESLGDMLAKGQGVETNKAEAALWFRRAADLGDPEAMLRLGVSLTTGRGVEKNRAEAANWFRRVLQNPKSPENVRQVAVQGLRTLGEEP